MVETLRQSCRSRSPDAVGEGLVKVLDQVRALCRFLRGVRRPASTILPMDPGEIRALEEARQRRARPSEPTFDHGKARRLIEERLVGFLENPAETEAEQGELLALARLYSACLSGRPTDDRLDRVLWICSLVEKGRAQ